MKQYLQNLLQKGYAVAENYIDPNDVENFTKEWEEIQKQALLEEYGIRSKENSDMPNYNVVYKQDKNYVWKSTGKIKNTVNGRKLIDKVLNDLRKIEPNISFMYDKFMNQKSGYQGHAPHQDNAVGNNEQKADKIYSAYVSLSDTDEQSGCLWVEDVQSKRITSLEYCKEGCVSGNACFCSNIKLLPIDMKNWRGHNLIPLPLKKGDCVFFDGWVLHGTASNLSENIRQTMIIHCGLIKDFQSQL